MDLRTLVRRFWPHVLALLALVTITATLTISSDQNGRPKVEGHVKIGNAVTKVDGADADTKRDDTLKLSAPAQQLVKRAEKAPDRFDLGGDLRGPDKTQAGVVHGPLASQEWPGCKTAFVKAFSQRTKPIRAIALHYTAGGNLAGWADIDGLTAFSNNLGNQVSWHFSIDREGHCAYNVPLNQKAWTISGLNSATVNIEVVGTGHDVDYAGAGYKRVSEVVRRIARIEHLPVALGATDGQCNVTKPGIITHWMGGPCSGGHIDIKPYAIGEVVARIAHDAQVVTPLAKAKRSHRIVHAKIAKRCRGRARHSAGCTALFKRNGQLHAKYGKALG